MVKIICKLKNKNPAETLTECTFTELRPAGNLLKAQNEVRFLIQIAHSGATMFHGFYEFQ